MRTVPFGPEPARHEPFDPVRLATTLGAPVAVLAQPADRQRVGSSFAESDFYRPPEPAGVMITHRFNDADPAVVVSVWTRRPRPDRPIPARVTELVARHDVPGPAGEADPRHHARQAAKAYLTDSAARRVVESSGRKRLPQAAHSFGVWAHDWRARSVTVDGRTAEWECFTGQDEAAEEEFLAVGGELGEVLVAVVGPLRLLDPDITIMTVHPQ